ncbi:MAG: hypothetical protein AAB176_08310 [Pseudomonadota bacterium]|jgi:hypothetical protein
MSSLYFGNPQQVGVPGSSKDLFHSHGQTVQRSPVFATGTRCIGLDGAFAGDLKGVHHHSVDGAIALRYAGDVLLQQLCAGYFACAQAGHQYGGGAVIEIGHVGRGKQE